MREKLRACIGNHKLSFPDMFTTLKRIEAMLNSRPLLKARSVHEEEPFVLTPSHFTIGKNITALPTISFPTPIANKREAYRARETIESQFWSYFYKKHINEIKNRTKWYQAERGFKVGDLCLLKDDNAPPLEWRKGLVIKTFPGVDNVVRVVAVRTAFGTFTRPTNKLNLIPGGCDSEDSEEAQEPPLMAPPNSPEPTEGMESMIKQQLPPQLPTIDENEVAELQETDSPLQDESVTTTGNPPDWNHMMDEDETVDPAQATAAPEPPPVSPLAAPKRAGRPRKAVPPAAPKAARTVPAAARRSRRLAAQVPLFLAMLFLLFHAVCGQNRVGAEIGGGLMVYEVETVLLDKGTFHVDLITGRTARADSLSINVQLTKLMKFCSQLKDTGTSCAASRYEIKQKALQAISKLADITNEDLSDRLETVRTIDVSDEESGFKRSKREIA